MKNKKLLLVLPAALMSLSLIGCGKRPEVSATTINVKLFLGGYGYEWLNEAIRKFENIYSEQGYKIYLYTPTAQNDGSFVRNDLISGYSKKQIDLYFTGNLKPIEVYNNGDVLVESLKDLVYDQKAIDFTGKEEDKTVRQKLDPSFGSDWYQYAGEDYCYFYQRSIGALVVNKTKLEKFGYDYLPTTTDQFMDMIHTIRYQAAHNNQLSRIRPFVTVGGTGYASVMINSWYTQLAGVEMWDQFWSMKDKDTKASMIDDGYEVFNDQELIDAGGLVFEAYDYENFVANSKNFSISTAHDYLINDDRGGVFLYDGDWALNETATDHDEEELKSLTFINVPVNSMLGTKLWGESAIPENKIDTVLSTVIACADNNKTYAEAVSKVKADLGYDITEADAQRVYAARGIYNNRGVQTGNAYVTKGIPETHKDIVGKFLRMIASDDFSKMYFKTAKCFSPYSSALDEDTSLLDFSKGHVAIATHKDAYAIWPFTSYLRKEIGGELERMFPTEPKYFHSVAEDCSYTAWDDDNLEWKEAGFATYREKASEEITYNYNYAKQKWDSWIG